MSRPRAFNVEQVRARVTRLFTQFGYRGTSLSMLTEASGLGKQSLYNAFGDKETLYLQALEASAEHLKAAAALLTSAPSGLAGIETFFDQLVQHCSHGDAAERACIVSSGLLEGPSEPRLARKLRQIWSDTASLFRSAVVRGQADGSIDPGLDPGDAATLLMSLMSGLRVTARAGNGVDNLRAAARLAIRTLATRM